MVCRILFVCLFVCLFVVCFVLCLRQFCFVAVVVVFIKTTHGFYWINSMLTSFWFYLQFIYSSLPLVLQPRQQWRKMGTQLPTQQRNLHQSPYCKAYNKEMEVQMDRQNWQDIDSEDLTQCHNQGERALWVLVEHPVRSQAPFMPQINWHLIKVHEDFQDGKLLSPSVNRPVA